MAHQKLAAGRGCVYYIREDDGFSTGPTFENTRYVGRTANFDVRLKQHQDDVKAAKNGSKTAGLNVDRKIASTNKQYFMGCLRCNLTASEQSAVEKEKVREFATFGSNSALQWNENEGG